MFVAPDMRVFPVCYDLKKNVFQWRRQFLCFQALQRETEGSEGKLLDLAKRTSGSKKCRCCMMLRSVDQIECKRI